VQCTMKLSLRYSFVKFSILIALLGSASGTLAWAGKSELKCSQGQKALSRSSSIFEAIEKAAESHAYFGDIAIKKSGPIENAILLQRCSKSAGTFEGITVNFRVPAKSSRGKTRHYVCLTRQKRTQSASTRWSSWIHVETFCRPYSASKVNDGSSYPSEGSSNSGSYAGPDELFDPDFAARTPDYGPDAVTDEFPSRGGGEFDDVLFLIPTSTRSSAPKDETFKQCVDTCIALNERPGAELKRCIRECQDRFGD
jgi:hypothetical protein